jgi:hypothetical protein
MSRLDGHPSPLQGSRLYYGYFIWLVAHKRILIGKGANFEISL